MVTILSVFSPSASSRLLCVSASPVTGRQTQLHTPQHNRRANRRVTHDVLDYRSRHQSPMSQTWNLLIITNFPCYLLTCARILKLRGFSYSNSLLKNKTVSLLCINNSETTPSVVKLYLPLLFFYKTPASLGKLTRINLLFIIRALAAFPLSAAVLPPLLQKCDKKAKAPSALVVSLGVSRHMGNLFKLTVQLDEWRDAKSSFRGGCSSEAALELRTGSECSRVNFLHLRWKIYSSIL